MFYECLICLIGMRAVTNGREIWKSHVEIEEWNYGKTKITVSLMGDSLFRLKEQRKILISMVQAYGKGAWQAWINV